MCMINAAHPGVIQCRPHRQEVAHHHRRPHQEATRLSIHFIRPHIVMLI